MLFLWEPIYISHLLYLLISHFFREMTLMQEKMTCCERSARHFDKIKEVLKIFLFSVKCVAKSCFVKHALLLCNECIKSSHCESRQGF